jgi:hypothetical protein
MPLVAVMTVLSGMPVMLVGLHERPPRPSHQSQHCQATHNPSAFLRHDEISRHLKDLSPARPGQEPPQILECTRHAELKNLFLSPRQAGFPAFDVFETGSRSHSVAPPTVAKPRHLSSFPRPNRCSHCFPARLNEGERDEHATIPEIDAAQSPERNKKGRHSRRKRVTALKSSRRAEIDPP